MESAGTLEIMDCPPPPLNVQASTPLRRFGRKVDKSGRTLTLSRKVPPPWLQQKVESPNSSKWINAAGLASSDICGAQQTSTWEFHERRRMSQQSSLWCGRLWGGWADVIFLPPFHFHSQTGLNFPHPYCHMMTYFDDLNPKGETKMTEKRWTFSLWSVLTWSFYAIVNKPDVCGIFETAASFIIAAFSDHSWLNCWGRLCRKRHNNLVTSMALLHSQYFNTVVNVTYLVIMSSGHVSSDELIMSRIPEVSNFPASLLRLSNSKTDWRGWFIWK